MINGPQSARLVTPDWIVLELPPAADGGHQSIQVTEVNVMETARHDTKSQHLNIQDAGFLTELIGLSSFLEQQDNLEHSLRNLTTLVAQLLRMENCSIMLLKEEAEQVAPRLRVFAHHGYLPAAAYQEAMELHQGIAGQVAGSGQPLLVTTIRHSPYAKVARCADKEGGGFICCPLLVNNKVIGVLNLSYPQDGRILSQDDLKTATVVALLVSKSIQVLQLQNLLRSNFIQFALARETATTPCRTLQEIAHNGAQMARILAKSFFREMQEAGFGTHHILSAATEIISLLNDDLATKSKGRSDASQ